MRTNTTASSLVARTFSLRTLAGLGLTVEDMRALTSVAWRTIAAIAAMRGHHDFAEVCLHVPSDDRYAFARVFAGEMYVDGDYDRSTLEHHRIGLATITDYKHVVPDMRGAFDAYTLLAYCDELRSVDHFIDELNQEMEFWPKLVREAESAGVCITCLAESIDARHGYDGASLVYALRILVAAGVMEFCRHHATCNCDRCRGDKFYADLLAMRSEPIEPRPRPRKKSRRDFADARELPGFLRPGECDICGHTICGCYDGDGREDDV